MIQSHTKLWKFSWHLEPRAYHSNLQKWRQIWSKQLQSHMCQQQPGEVILQHLKQPTAKLPQWAQCPGQESDWFYTTTQNHIYTLHTLIQKHIHQNKNKIFSCFVVFKRALNSIWHHGLCLKLLEKGIGGKIYNIIKTMYINNKCAVKIGTRETDFFPQIRGVRQGCTLSPTLFNIYIDELAKSLEESDIPGLTLSDIEVKCLLFADDLILLAPSKEALQ